MRFIAVVIISIFSTLGGLYLSVASAAPNTRHNHDGRTHSHTLPATGVKHFHKHMHNGRAHIHPYSAKIGFKHSHNKSNPRAKAWENAVKHSHDGRPHSHPLPPKGKKHEHTHRHGGRTHLHPLPINGAKHFHQLNKKPNKQIAQQPRTKSGLSIQQQMAAVLNTPIANIQKTKRISKKEVKTTPTQIPTQARKNRKNNTASVLNQRTINKVLGYNKHANRGHQHKLPASGKKHSHKKTKAKNQRPLKKVASKPAKKQRVAKANKAQKRVIKPFKTRATSKQTPKQIAEGNRQFSLALRYENGTGVKQNFPQAVNWYLRSAKQGNTKAQFNLATLYEEGKGVARNIPQAIRWYTTAANNGDVNAQLNLGNRYAQGKNVPKNIQEAAKWYKRAADQGDVRGRANLNYLIEDYNGVIKR